jgi:hypothetical protein
MLEFLGVDIKMYGESRSFGTSLPISPAFVTSTITALAEKAHPVGIFNGS